jgi:hypothetical protein
MNFLKLKDNFNVPNFEKGDLKTKYGIEIDGIWRGIKYFRLNQIDEENVKSILPKKIRSDFEILLMIINSTIPPHTDDLISLTINIYLETSLCKTQFYSYDPSHPTSQLENQKNGRLFDPKNLKLEDSFVAREGEVWLLNVTTPHSVYPIEKSQRHVQRTAISLQTSKYSFDDIKELIENDS